MKTRVLSGADIQRLALHVGLDTLMDEMIDRLETGLRSYSAENTVVFPRRGFAYDHPETGLLEWMPCMNGGGRATIKVVGYHPANVRQRDLPTILATVSEYDTCTGHLICIMDGTLLTALRTGAASAVASRALAAPHTETLGLIGAGAQAITQLHALSRLFAFREVLVHDSNPAIQASFAERAACIADPLSIRTASLEDVVRTSDVICTATSVEVGDGPLFDNIEPRPWVHINAVGSDFPGKIELPFSLLQRSLVCPDDREQAIKEGECQQLPPETIGPSLYQLVQQQAQYRFAREQTTVFDSTGWALEDQIAMHVLAAHAEALSLGSFVSIEAISEDVMNPYHFARSRAQTSATA